MHLRSAQPGRIQKLSIALAGACFAVLSSCNEPTAPGAERPLRAAIALAASADRLGSVGNTMMAPMFVPPVQPDPICDYVAGEQRYECPPIGAAGFIVLRRYQLRGLDDQAVTRWSGAVESIFNVYEVTGSSSLGVVSGADTAMLSGVGEATHTLTGTRRTTFNTNSVNGTVTRVVTRTTALTIPRASTVESYPTGTITYTASGGTGPTSVVLTFDGTAKYTVVRTTTTSTLTCTYDLRPTIAPVC